MAKVFSPSKYFSLISTFPSWSTPIIKTVRAREPQGILPRPRINPAKSTPIVAKTVESRREEVCRITMAAVRATNKYV